MSDVVPEIVNDRVHTELLALQTLAAADIAFYKQQQWQATNYAALLYAAIVASAKLVSPPLKQIELVGLLGLTTVVLVAGLFVLHALEQSLSRSRDRLPAARTHFNREISLRAYACGGNPAEALIKSHEKASLRWLFQGAIFTGYLLTTWLLIRA